MPCNSDHMAPHTSEIELSRVACLLDELNGITSAKGSWNGTHPRVYCKGLSKEAGDEMVAELCARIQTINVTGYSLELQMWWRDHLRADYERIGKQMQHAKTDAEREAALAKLTPYERELLGYKG